MSRGGSGDLVGPLVLLVLMFLLVLAAASELWQGSGWSGARWLSRLPGVSPVRSRTSYLTSSTKLVLLPVSRSTSSFLFSFTSS